MAGYNSYGTYKDCSTDIMIHGHGCSGGFIGSDFSGSYENCTAKGNVSGQWSVGGFAGILFYNSEAKHCVADVKITANDWNAGGFVGYIEENVTIHNCISYGDVHSKVNRWEPNVGGFTGISNLNCSIDNSYAAGKVTAESTDYKAGGFVGYDKGGRVTSCSYDAKKNPELKGVGETKTAGTNKVDITALKVNLSETEYTYNGKVKQPAVIIKDQNGNVISSTNYTVTYASGRKKPGTYSVQITMKGNYTGTQTVLFNIRGKKMPAPKLKAHSRALKVTWKKQKAITGYQIQYSTNAKFKKSKTKIVKIAKGRQTSKFIKKLKARKKYYVRVRSYKTTKIGGKTYNAYSVWSKTKKVIVKK